MGKGNTENTPQDQSKGNQRRRWFCTGHPSPVGELL